jgi:hypothetical protein
MQRESETSLASMAELNNSVIALIDGSECTTVEAIMVLRAIAFRLDKAFEMAVMGNPVASIAKKVKDG